MLGIGVLAMAASADDTGTYITIMQTQSCFGVDMLLLTHKTMPKCTTSMFTLSVIACAHCYITHAANIPAARKIKALAETTIITTRILGEQEMASDTQSIQHTKELLFQVDRKKLIED